MEITTDMIRCAKCHDNNWKDNKCTNCGSEIDMGYIGSRTMYEQLLEAVEVIDEKI